MKFLLGRKLGMTQIYNDHGAVEPVTVIEAGPCVITQLKTQEKDGYLAVQIGFGGRRKVTKPVLGHLQKSQLSTTRLLRERRIRDAADLAGLEVGQKLDVTSFAVGDPVTVIGVSKGKGYAGVVKRHGFAGGPGSHGSDFHRAPGSIGGRWPQRVTKGRRMAGHLGATRVTQPGLQVLRIDSTAQLLAVRGAIPGPKRSLVEIRG